MTKHSFHPWKPPTIYAWDIATPRAGRCVGAIGVVGDRRQALAALEQALREAPPGSQGVVQRVELSPSGRAEYDYLGLIASALHDESSGTVVWGERGEVSMDAPRSLDMSSAGDALASPIGVAPRARLEALAAHLKAHQFAVNLSAAGLVVRNPETIGCCPDENPAPLGDMITCRAHRKDGCRLWFFTSWQQPIAEADRITDAVVQIKGYLAARK